MDAIQYEAAMQTWEEALARLMTGGWTKSVEVVDCYTGLGECQMNIGQYEAAYRYLGKGLELGRELEDDRRQTRLYNLMGLCLWSQKQFDRALDSLQRAIALQLGEIDDPQLGDTYLYMGICYQEKADYIKAIHYTNSALKIYQSLLEPKHEKIGSAFMSLGVNYQYIGNDGKVLKYFKEALSISESAFGTQHPKTASIYHELGRYTYGNGEYARAASYFEKSISIYENHFGPGQPFVSLGYAYLGNCFRELYEAEKALSYYEKALDRVAQSPEGNQNDLGFIYQNIGSLYLGQQKVDKALIYFRKALAYSEQVYGKDHLYYALFSNFLGDAHMQSGEWDKALPHLKKALQRMLFDYGDEHRMVARGCNKMAICYRGKAAFEESERYSQQALNALLYTDASGPALEKVISFPDLLDALHNMALTYKAWHAQSGELQYLEKAAATYEDLVAFIDEWRIGFQNESSKLILIREGQGILENAISVALQLYRTGKGDAYLEQAFQYAEKGQSILLLENLRAADARQFAGIPDELLAREASLRDSLNMFKKLRYDEERKGAAADVALQRQYADEAFRLKAACEAILAQYQENYPDFYQLKYQLQPIELSRVQQQLLKKGQALLEYFVGDQTLFCFLIDQKQVKVWEQPIAKDFVRRIDSLRKMIAAERPISELDGLRKSLSEQLLLGWPAETPDFQELIIVPGGILGYLPFELLDHKGDYLLEHFTISYNYSASLLELLLEKSDRKATHFFGGFAPQYTFDPAQSAEPALEDRSISQLVRKGHYNLPGARKEVQQIAALLDGDAILGAAATEARFKEIAVDYKVLHLAMHSLLEDRQPLYSRLLFSADSMAGDDGALHAIELYNMQLKAELAVLSACNTGVGRLHRGEGIMSLSRAFAYAGVPATVMSLWKVPDDATSELMLQFYTHLSEGLSKAEALRQAKLAWLERDDLPASRKHPYYWAGFVAAGDMAPLQDQGAWPEMGWWLVGIGLLLLGLYFFRNRSVSS